MLSRQRTLLLVLLGVAGLGLAAAQRVTKTISNAHVAGKIAHGGSAKGKDGKEHLLVGVKLAIPFEGGIDRVEAVVTHNEPSERVKDAITIYSGNVSTAGWIYLSCPSIKIVSTNGKISAWANDCTFDDYDGPTIP